MDTEEVHFETSHMDTISETRSTGLEIMLILITVVFYMVSGTLLTSISSSLITTRKTYQFLIEFLAIIVPLILHVTVFAQYIYKSIITLCVVICSLLLFIFNQKTIKPNGQKQIGNSYITNVRSLINIVSVIAILAVDFKVFPSRFSKTEKMGFSLMDMGVGLYVYSNGIVSPEARGETNCMKKTLIGTLELLVIGVLRLVVTSLTDYHVSAKEYGVHWNFFMTLAVIRLLTSSFLNVVNIKHIYINAILLMICHEYLLETGLKDFVFDYTDRDNFITANKEGIVSTLGYICIYLSSVYFGYIIDIKGKQVNLNLKFMIASIICFFSMYGFLVNFGISRRVANCAYCLWVLFVGIFLTWLMYLWQNIQKSVCENILSVCIYSSYINEAVNYNGLIFFLIGNVLTGLINLSIITETVENSVSLPIIVIYMFVTCFLTCLLYEKKIKLKFR